MSLLFLATRVIEDIDEGKAVVTAPGQAICDATHFHAQQPPAAKLPGRNYLPVTCFLTCYRLVATSMKAGTALHTAEKC